MERARSGSCLLFFQHWTEVAALKAVLLPLGACGHLLSSQPRRGTCHSQVPFVLLWSIPLHSLPHPWCFLTTMLRWLAQGDIGCILRSLAAPSSLPRLAHLLCPAHHECAEGKGWWAEKRPPVPLMLQLALQVPPKRACLGAAISQEPKWDIPGSHQKPGWPL